MGKKKEKEGKKKKKKCSPSVRRISDFVEKEGNEGKKEGERGKREKKERKKGVIRFEIMLIQCQLQDHLDKYENCGGGSEGKGKKKGEKKLT